MRKLPSAFLYFLVVTVLFTFVMTASAHPGKTDSNGGHWDSETGEYHYHHGYPAHDHYDADGDGTIDCPYDFDDQTNHSSGSNGSGTSAPTKSSREDTIVELWIVCVMALVFAVAITFMFFYIASKNNAIKDLHNKHKQEVDEQTKCIQRNLMCLNSDIIEKYGNSYLYQICGAPNGDYLGEDNLPTTYDTFQHAWGEKYTFYLSSQCYSRTKRIHRLSCRHASPQHPVNAYRVNRSLYDYEPCRICKPSVPDTAWVDKYLKYKAFFTKYEISVPQDSVKQEIDKDPYLGTVTRDMLENYALELGVSATVAFAIINQKRKSLGIEPLSREEFHCFLD